MASLDNSQTPIIERRLLRWLLLFHCLFIIYGSFIPFHFNLDPEFIKYRLTRFLTYEYGVRQFSIPDVFSNILLFVPFGFLWIGGMPSEQWGRRFWRAVPVLGALGLVLGLMIESGQMLSPGRVASLLDAVCNGIGSAMGAAAGCFLFRARRGKLGSTFSQLLQEQPSVVLLALLILAPVAEAYYPFDVTLDVSTVWNNFRYIRWVPFAAGLHRFWLDLLVEKVLIFGAISYLALRNLPQAWCSGGRATAWITCSAFALLIEGGKLFFVGRVPNAENAIFSAVGALFGVLFIPRLAATALARQYGRQILTVLLLSIITYSELSPFDWIQSTDQIPRRVSKIEWLPFASYYYGEPQSVIFDLAKKVFLLAPLGFLIAAGHHNRSSKRRHRVAAAAAGLMVGLVLEAGQLGLPSRTPSITDVLLFGITAWIGAVIFERYWQIRTVPMSVRHLASNKQRSLSCH
jgi:VanZ family protein